MLVPKHLIREILNLPYEEWRDIRGFENKYQVSNYAQVRSLNYGGTGKIKRLSLILMTNGYVKVDLWKDNKSYPKYVHRLVAECFISNPNNLPCVNHKDENPSNNNVNNLEWCSYEYNNTYGTRLERLSQAMKGKPSNMKGKHHTEETKRKISQSKKGKTLTKSNN